MAPAASTAFEPSGIGQARTSSGPGGQERDEPEQLVRQRDDPVQAGLGDAELLHEHRRLVGLELAELHLDPGRQGLDHRVLVRIAGPDRARRAPARAARSPSPTLSRTRTGFSVRKRKPRMALLSSASRPRSRIGVPASSPAWMRRTTTSSRSAASRSAGVPCRPLPLSRSSRRSAMARSARVNSRSSCSRSRAGVDAAGRVRMGRVLERAHDVEQRVAVAQPGEVVGRQLLGPDPALGRGRRRGQVDVGHVGLDDLLGLEDLGQAVEPLVGHLDDADVEGDPAVAAGLGVATGQGVEDGRLATPGKPDDGDLHGPDGSGRPARSVAGGGVDDVEQRLAGWRTGAGCRRTARRCGRGPARSTTPCAA